MSALETVRCINHLHVHVCSRGSLSSHVHVNVFKKKWFRFPDSWNKERKMAAQTDERVDEMIVPKCRVWNIEEKQSHIQDRFHVQIVYGARHDQDQWIGVKGEQENRDLAKVIHLICMA